MGISEREFWDMSNRAFMNKLAGFRKDREYQEKQDWERARFVGAIAAGVKTKDIPLPWDNEQKTTKYTKEEAEAMRKEVLDALGKTFK